MSVNAQVIRVLRRNLKQSLKNRQLLDSENLVDRLKIEDPVSLETRGLELEFLIAKERWPDAHSLAEQLRRLYPDSARIQFLNGRLKYKLKQYQDALQFFEESNRIHPHWVTQRWLGKSYTQAGQFEHAEAFLLGVLEGHRAVQLDLAWLYERSDQPHRALAHVRSYLEDHPDDLYAKEQEIRLNAQTARPETLAEEIRTLLELDEEIPPGMLPSYITYQLESAQTQSVRDFLSAYRSRLDRNTVNSIAWVCYKLQAYDIAMDLFLQGFPEKARDVKFLTALETAALRCNRIEELVACYETEASQEKKFYGRISRLRKDSEKLTEIR